MTLGLSQGFLTDAMNGAKANRCAFIPPLRGQKETAAPAGMTEKGMSLRTYAPHNVIPNGVCAVRNRSDARLSDAGGKCPPKDRCSRPRSDSSLALGMTFWENADFAAHLFSAAAAGRLLRIGFAPRNRSTSRRPGA